MNIETFMDNIPYILQSVRQDCVPAYVAAAQVGLTPHEFVKLSREFKEYSEDGVHLMTEVSKAEYKAYNTLLNDADDTTAKERLFDPIYNYPPGDSDSIATLRVRFDKPENTDMINKFFE